MLLQDRFWIWWSLDALHSTHIRDVIEAGMCTCARHPILAMDWQIEHHARYVLMSIQFPLVPGGAIYASSPGDYHSPGTDRVVFKHMTAAQHSSLYTLQSTLSAP